MIRRGPVGGRTMARWTNARRARRTLRSMRMQPPRYILEINTRLWLRELGGGTPATLRGVPDAVLEAWVAQGFDAIWLMGIWLPSVVSREIAAEHAGLRADYSRILPDWTPADVIGSPYAISGYRIPPEWGGEEALADLRARMQRHGLRLILDFVPNHTARDHPWVFDHPSWYVRMTDEELAQNPEHGFRVISSEGDAIIAHGKDPYFPPWTDTAQLDYCNPELQRAQQDVLHRLAERCDGVRCDVAMLLLPQVFEQVWGGRMPEFWEPAIKQVKQTHPDFCFIAETYWELDQALNERGFDLTYDKDLLDQIVSDLPLIYEQFNIPVERHQQRLRFLENHDEPHIASRLWRAKHMAAATWLFMLPSSTLVYAGELEGRKSKSPIQLRRDPREPPEPVIKEFYERLLRITQSDVVRRGRWQLLPMRPAWIGNDSCRVVLGQSYDWEDRHLRVFVNWSNKRSQCYVDIHLGRLHDREVVLRDQLGPKKYVRQGTELMMRGLYLDLDPWESLAFLCEPREVTVLSET
jgi:hypothetical protein